MSRYNLSEGKFGKFTTVILSDSKTNRQVEIALRGATVLNYHLPVKDEIFNIIDGYVSPEELEEQSGSRSCIMAPFSNRIENSTYKIGNEIFQVVNPINPNREAIHGFTRVMDFKIKNVESGNNNVEVTLFGAIRRGSFQGFPFCIDIWIKYTMMNSKLFVDIIAKNVGIEQAPFGCGWHPYFKTSNEGIDHLALTIPSEETVTTDEKHIPLQGESAYSPISENPKIDFRPGQDEAKNIIGNRKVNNCFSKLAHDSDGFSRTSIKDSKSGLMLTVFQKGGVLYAYTGDEVKYRPRTSIALEPVQYITNAFNRPELKENIMLKPGDTSIFSCGIEVHNLMDYFVT